MSDVLVLSFSPIARDARVLRQVRALADVGTVTTCGHGEAPPGAADHLAVPEALPSLPRTPTGVALLSARRWGRAELAAPAVARALRMLEGRRFDLVVANEARALPVGHRVARGAPVWADMHEYATEEFPEDVRWRLLVKPFAAHLCRRYLPPSAAVTTVSQGLADLYSREYGIECGVVRNAPAHADLTPCPVPADRVRLVHSGAAIPGRHLESLVDAVHRLDERFTLDLYLVPGGDGGRYLRRLRAQAADDPRIRFPEPVAPDRLPEVLNQYDLGVFVLPPTSVNKRHTLPNKFFDFVQGRLGIVVGPSPEMARLVEDLRLGVVTDDFATASLVRTLSAVTRVDVVRWKDASHRAAPELSFERDGAAIRELASDLLAGSAGREP